MYHSLYSNDMGWYKEKSSTEIGDGSGWNGPYLPYLSEDPWGYKYLIAVCGFEGGRNPDNHVWILSAHQNFFVDTPTFADDTRWDIGIKFE